MIKIGLNMIFTWNLEEISVCVITLNPISTMTLYIQNQESVTRVSDKYCVNSE